VDADSLLNDIVAAASGKTPFIDYLKEVESIQAVKKYVTTV
jgi:hypothetical protein